MEDDLKVPFGVRADGLIVHITELSAADNGLRCACTCPRCGARFIARNKGTKDPGPRKPARWNGEYYVSFGYPKDVVQAGSKYGFFVAGGGDWYTKSMDMLSVGDRVWVYLGSRYYGSHNGFVGVARSSRRDRPSTTSPSTRTAPKSG